MMDYESVVKDAVAAQDAYPIDTTACRIKLDANENPFSPSPLLRKRLHDLMEGIQLNRYPAPGSPGLKEKFARQLKVESEMIMVGNGSDELIQILLTAFRVVPERGIMIPVPTFPMYGISGLNNGHRMIEVPLKADFTLDRNAMMQAISESNPQAVFLAYPNNPTGNCFDAEDVEEIITAVDGMVIIDEAYFNFSKKTLAPLLAKYENLVILRTLSKVGLAALRIGCLAGHPPFVRQLEKVRLPYNLNLFSQLAGEIYFECENLFTDQVQRIITERDRLFTRLKEIKDINPHHSDANFILFDCAREKNGVYERLLRNGILIKNFASAGPLANCMRVTVGTEGENREFVEALKNAVRR